MLPSTFCKCYGFSYFEGSISVVQFNLSITLPFFNQIEASSIVPHDPLDNITDFQLNTKKRHDFQPKHKVGDHSTQSTESNKQLIS